MRIRSSVLAYLPYECPQPQLVLHWELAQLTQHAAQLPHVCARVPFQTARESFSCTNPAWT
eukprot:6195521-Pleurochrysis_carterae.AAC.2